MSDKTVNITIDDKTLEVPEGKKILWAALENDIYIPNLCAVKDIKRPPASCRLCFVEVEGKESPVTACTQKATEGMVIKTRSERLDRLVETAFNLLMSDHDLNCKECPKNRNCELQKIAKERGLKLKQKKFNDLQEVNEEKSSCSCKEEIDDSPKIFAINRKRCVLCGKCVYADRELAKIGAIGFSGRSIKRCVATFQDLPISETSCIECGKCVDMCPVGALYYK